MNARKYHSFYCPSLLAKESCTSNIKARVFSLSFSLLHLLYEYLVPQKVWLPEKSTFLPPAFNSPHVDFQAYALYKRT